jgi:hypothetical protein
LFNTYDLSPVPMLLDAITLCAVLIIIAGLFWIWWIFDN